MSDFNRDKLVDGLRKKGIRDERVLKAIAEVHRELFIPAAIKHHAYEDVALPIGQGQTISQPYTVAFMTEALKINEGDSVLEIGTGSGYQAAILINMGVKVFSIERNTELYNKSLKLFDKLGLRVAVRCSDGTLGWNDFAPYNGIIVTAGAPSIPENLKKQLAVGGRLVVPVGDKKSQILKVLTKVEEDRFLTEDIPQFKFVPLIGREGWKE
ncbi:MAG: protein-L-isoaspartate(D-aspartate) O-methyltransferase [Melioribacteraceae bacterium]|nr:protein-L-isoaspartate(D-aspartate) O-methyltransferase [Melioribacteraceae bacterium]MCF8355991.1 protein-L-isoaspartate(D-aspartate) O-methyltransferase [Melioribacteraceae bacterium]MCF8396105.1 protein-L-isoaspartate(D-aspartate) O-methyltransferase [Melioribacteraceae bacterium]MCF8419600.1 protein-L-isoaspartate(D-aspartate) O-methyltransferase [Melioribacteraceae bacterium]